MNFQFHQTAGHGMSPESFAAFSRSKLFRPAIAFEDDNGTGAGGSSGSGGSGGDPQPATDPVGSGGSSGEDTTNLKLTLQKERDRANALDKQMKQLQESIKGIDPEKYKQLEQLQKQAEQWNQKEIQIRNDVESEWKPKVQAEIDKGKEFEQKYLGLLKRTIAEASFQGAKGRSGAGEDGITYFDTLLAVVNNHLRLNDKGEIEVIDNNGARRFSAKDATKLMTPQEYFETLHKHPVLGHCFQPTGNSNGGGMQPGSGNTQSYSKDDVGKLSRAERLAMSRQG